MKKIFMVILFLIFLVGGLLFYAASPASSKQFPNHGIIQFSKVNPSDLAPKPMLTVITYNIGYASGEKNNRAVRLTKEEVIQNLDKMIDELKAMNADLLFLQEVDFQSARTFEINQLEYLAKGLKLPYAAYVVTWNKRYLPWPYWPIPAQFGKMVSGQAILSRYPISNQVLTKLSKPESKPFWYNWFYLDRMIQKLSVFYGDKPISVWNVHLEAFDSKTRANQAVKLAQLVGEDKNPLKIVAGDFNSVSLHTKNGTVEDHGEALNAILKITGLSNAENRLYYSFPSWNPERKIDHILYCSGFELLEMENLKFVASDHLPIWARLFLQF